MSANIIRTDKCHLKTNIYQIQDQTNVNMTTQIFFGPDKYYNYDQTNITNITNLQILLWPDKYIYDQNRAVFESLGRTWHEMMTEFLPGRFKDAIRTTYPEISRPDLVVKNFLRDIARIFRDF